LLCCRADWCILQVDQKNAAAWMHLALIYDGMQCYSKAAELYRGALKAHDPINTNRVLQACAAVSTPLLMLGEVEEAIEVLEHGLKTVAATRKARNQGSFQLSVFDGIAPTYVQTYLFALCSSDKPRDEVSKLHMEYGRHIRTYVGPVSPVEILDKDPGRRLRIGYLSADLRRHVVAQCLAGIMRSRDRETMHVTCYQRNFQEDEYTEMLRSLSDDWIKCAGESGEQVNQRIRSDKIDILVDLGGHTGASQMNVLARCPAPIQVSWIGYPNTTGLDCMHYRITDAVADPIDSTQVYSEKLVRLPTFFNCLQKSEMLDVSPGQAPPMAAKGFCTFGSFNSLRKHSKRTKRTWGRVMMAVPNAQLMIKDRAFKHPPERERWTAGFLQCALDKSIPGVSFKTGPNLKKRLRLEPGTPSHEHHWRLYDEMDIMLDSWPYCGTVTSAECLMMGVPIVTLQAPGTVSLIVMLFFIWTLEQPYANPPFTHSGWVPLAKRDRIYSHASRPRRLDCQHRRRVHPHRHRAGE
jgi:predicted O-linked N-acetylglucosamine transferase (SPINDLY family)